MKKLYCATNSAVILLAIQPEQGPMVFPNLGSSQLPGVRFPVKPRESIDLQILEQCGALLGCSLNAQDIEINQEFSSAVEGEQPGTLYLAKLKGSCEFDVELNLEVLPKMIRAMPKNRNRLAYLRAWQFLSGSDQEVVKVVESDQLPL